MFVQLGLQVIKAIILVLGVRSSTNNKAQEIKNVYIVGGIAEIRPRRLLHDGRQQLKSSGLDVLDKIHVVAGNALTAAMLWRGSFRPPPAKTNTYFYSTALLGPTQLYSSVQIMQSSIIG